MGYNDSMKKIESYYDSLNKKTVILSEKFFRSYKCSENCAGCCHKFSLDYVDNSDRWDRFKRIYPQYVHKFEKRNFKGGVIWSNFQKDNDSVKCEFVNWENGHCMIHEVNPFSCEFELMRFITHSDKTYLMNRLFGRGWNMLRIDGERGALCEILSYDEERTQSDLKLLKELEETFKILYNTTPKSLSNIIKFIENLNTVPKNNIHFYNNDVELNNFFKGV